MKKLLLPVLLLLPFAAVVPAGAAPAAAPDSVPVLAPAPEGGACLDQAPALDLSLLPQEGQTRPVFKATVAECYAYCAANPDLVRFCRITGARCGLIPDVNECGCWYP